MLKAEQTLHCTVFLEKGITKAEFELKNGNKIIGVWQGAKASDFFSDSYIHIVKDDNGKVHKIHSGTVKHIKEL